MLAYVLEGPSYHQIKQQIIENENLVDLFEIRFDSFEKLELKEIQSLLQKKKKPFIFTLRKSSHGGAYLKTEEERKKEIWKLLSLNPDYFDLEYDMDLQFIQKAVYSFPKIQWIISFHEFQKPPKDLICILEKMKKPFPAIYKIAWKCFSSLDLLYMMEFAHEYCTKERLSLIAMGEYGTPFRALGPIFQNTIDYTSKGNGPKETSQIPLLTLLDTYSYRFLNRETNIYALLGDPISQSIGHQFHNDFFRKHEMNAIYIKCRVKKEELRTFLQKAKKLPFQGFSITMPLKEEVLPFVLADEKGKAIGALNTLRKNSNTYFGTNTDAEGALDAIEKKCIVAGKKCVVLGAGGTAKAIIYEAKKRGAKVFVVNRTYTKACNLAASYFIQAVSIKHFSSFFQNGYDLIINTTPEGSFFNEFIFERVHVMDVVYYPLKTSFLQKALEKNCKIIFGMELFENQAFHQQNFWNQ